MSKFRKGVCGIFISANGTILMGERLKDQGQWQLPQGGIEDSETALEALHREMFEEVGVSGVKIIRQTERSISYHWPIGLFPGADFIGQEHIYFLLDGSAINIDELSTTLEFSRFAWFSVDQVLEKIVEWKKPVYLQAFQLLGI